MNRAKWIYITIIVACLGITLVATYYSLGGFDKLEVYAFEGSSRTVIGQHYIGEAKSPDIRMLVDEVKEMVDNERLKGQFTLVEYFDDAISEDSIHLFIGASFEGIKNVLELPAGYTFEEFNTRKIYRAFITQHPLVRPYPAEIRSMMEVRAIEDGEVLAPFTFDIYYDDGSLRTESWVRE